MPYCADLHLAIGNLKQVDATKNGASGALQQCDFFSSTGEIIQGAALLDVWGPLWFVIARELLPILVPELGEAFCAAKNADDINALHRRQRVRARPTGIWLSRSLLKTAGHTIL